MSERYDAILAHCYGYRETRNGVRGSIRMRMQARAVAEIAKREDEAVIFMGAAKLWGENYPSLADLLASEITKRGIALSRLIVIPQAWDTPQEVDLFLKEAQKNGWVKIADVANDSHYIVIKEIYRRRQQNPDCFSTEDILLESEHTTQGHGGHFRGFIERFRNSEIEEEFRKREKIISLAYKLGLEKLLSLFAMLSRKRKFSTKFDF